VIIPCMSRDRTRSGGHKNDNLESYTRIVMVLFTLWALYAHLESSGNALRKVVY
jgi:hypothetical protein